jgi:hypothetical protein
MTKFSGTKRRPLRTNLTAPIKTLGRRTRTYEGGRAFPLIPRWAPPVAAVAVAGLVGGILLLGRANGSANLQVQRAGAASQTSIPRTVQRGPASTIPVTVTTPAVSTDPNGVAADTRPQPPAAAPSVPTGGGAKGQAPPSASPTTSPAATLLHGTIRWPDTSAAAGINVMVYPQGFGSSRPAVSTPPSQPLPPSTTVLTGREGTYATPICTTHRCQGLQAFLAIPVSGNFPDGCVLPLTTKAGPATGFSTLGGTIDWTVTDGTCAADPAGTPIDDPDVPAFTTEYVEQKIDALLATSTGSTTTTTTQ